MYLEDGKNIEILSFLSKIEKAPRGTRGEKSSKDMASPSNSVSTIGALASPKMGDGTRQKTHRQKLSNTTFFRRHCFGSCRTEYVGNGNQIC